VRHGRLGGQEHRGQVQAHDVVEEGLVHLGQRLAGDHAAGDIDQGADRTAEGRERRVDQRLDVGGGGHVALQDQRAAAGGLDFGQGRLGALFAAEIVDRHIGPFGRQL
jgi:hypothetical protein